MYTADLTRMADLARYRAKRTVVLAALLVHAAEAQQMCTGNADPTLDFTSTACAAHAAGADLLAGADQVAGTDHTTCCSCPTGWYMHESDSVPTVTRCRPCPAGTEPANQTACAPCVGNTFSAAGQCVLCAGDATANHQQCQPCGIHEVADPPEDGCRCENGYYNKTGGLLQCFSRARSYEPAPADAIAHHCVLCPDDCVDCLYDGYTGRPLLQQGFGTSPAGPDWFDQSSRVVFECPGADKLACREETKDELLGLNVSSSTNRSTWNPCIEGYEPPLCTICSPGFRIGGTGCTHCEGFSLMALTVVLFVAFIFFVMAAESSTTLRHNRVVRGLGLNVIGRKVRGLIVLIKEMFNDVKVFLTLYQVLSSMGQTLEMKCAFTQTTQSCAAPCYLTDSAVLVGRPTNHR